MTAQFQTLTQALVVGLRGERERPRRSVRQHHICRFFVLRLVPGRAHTTIALDFDPAQSDAVTALGNGVDDDVDVGDRGDRRPGARVMHA